MELYKAEHGGKSFNFAHCYKLLKDNKKWKELHNILKRGRGQMSVPRSEERRVGKECRL